MLSIQETLQKDAVQPQLQLIKRQLDSGKFHPSKGSLLNVESLALRMEIAETLRTIPLKEFLAKSGTTGIGGAAYMVPDKLHADLIFYSQQTDLVPLISAQVVEGWSGGNLLVDIADDETYKPQYFHSGAKLSMTSPTFVQATIKPASFGINLTAGADLVEDTVKGRAGNLIDVHIRTAAQNIGRQASDMALNILKTATDGVGTVNSGATGDADETKLVAGTTNDVVGCIRDVGNDRFLVNTMVVTPEAWGHSISGQAAEVGWQVARGTNGYTLQFSEIDVLKSTSPQLHDSADAVGAAMTACVTLLFDRNNALLTGRKRWMQIENFGNPVSDLAGAVITCRQDSVTLYDDSIYVLTET